MATRSTYRSPWKFISSLDEDFGLLVCFKVGNWRRIRFWLVWWGEEAFSNRFIDLCRLSLAHNDMIAEMCISHNTSSNHGWDLQLYRNLHERELESFAISLWY